MIKGIIPVLTVFSALSCACLGAVDTNNPAGGGTAKEGQPSGAVAGAANGKEIGESALAGWPESIQIVLSNTAPLKHSRGSRLPLFLWPAMNPGRLSEARALTLVRELDRRGIGLICRWDSAHYEDSLADALPVARAQKSLGLPVAIDATSLLYSFFNGDKSTAHIDMKGEPFWDTSFPGKGDMGCPFALDGRKGEIRGRVEKFVAAYSNAGLTPGFVWADWELDGPVEWNGAWEASKRCRRCVEHSGQITNFLQFQHELRGIRSELQRSCYVEPLLRRFPSCLVGNYGTYPHDGFRYWYDYFETDQDWYPGLRDGRALHRHWANEFDPAGYTFAMPVIYTWSRMWHWSGFENPDYHWFYPMLQEATSCARSVRPGLPIVSFVHWNTTVPPTPPDASIKQFSVEGYQELLWHMLLRGVSTFYLWCPAPEYTSEVQALYPVWAAAQEYGEFLEKGRPISFDVPAKPGAVISGLELNGRVLVRRTDFAGSTATVVLKLGGRELSVPPSKGKCQILDLRESR
ncbi:MAG: hypothetical protein WCR20_02460 [Verrucomicrobiota bacterium]